MINKILTNFVVTEDGIQRIQKLLQGLVHDVDAVAALLIEKSGQVLATQGDTMGLDCQAMASLVSGAFASTRAVARMIGETEFQAMFQQGETASVFMYALGTNDILVVVFDDQTKTGLVKVQAQQTAVALTSAINQMHQAD
ncbi:MAG: roadblock/LC7 domain-containing protein [Candidatus Sericytochromatia bacterium]|nr:roadblock/LC7 domain-containing protein [Candidatus Sericytochromatia bacterium]